PPPPHTSLLPSPTLFRPPPTQSTTLHLARRGSLPEHSEYGWATRIRGRALVSDPVVFEFEAGRHTIRASVSTFRRDLDGRPPPADRKSTRLNSSHQIISY